MVVPGSGPAPAFRMRARTSGVAMMSARPTQPRASSSSRTTDRPATEGEDGDGRVDLDDGPSVDLTFLGAAALVGLGTGAAVAVFKTSIAAVVAACYSGDDLVMPWARRAGLGGPAVLIPAAGGLAVGLLRLASPRNQLGPGLAEHVAEVEREIPLRVSAPLARAIAAVATLGTGSALGPEGPSVEIGVSISRIVGWALPPRARAARRGVDDGGAVCDGTLRQQRELIAAGAAAGVAAGFNAPLAGVFFALEVVSEAVRAAVPAEEASAEEASAGGRGGQRSSQRGLALRQDLAELDIKSSEAIAATVISALVAAVAVQYLLGDDLALRPGDYSTAGSLVQLPLYVGLGVLSGGVALLFKWASETSRELFARLGDGSAAGDPSWAVLSRPAVGGLACGLVGAAFPQALIQPWNLPRPCTGLALAWHWPCTDLALTLHWPSTGRPLTVHWPSAGLPLTFHGLPSGSLLRVLDA